MLLPPQFKLAVASTLAVAAAQNPAQPTYPVEWSATSEWPSVDDRVPFVPE